MFLSNLKPQDVPQLHLRDPFLREIIEHWTNLNYREENRDFNSIGLWHNALIIIANRPIFYTSWLKAGVKEVIQIYLMKITHSWASFCYNAKFNIKTNYLEYLKVITASKKFKKVCLPALDNPSTNDAASLLSQSNTNNLTDALCKTKPSKMAL